MHKVKRLNQQLLLLFLILQKNNQIKISAKRNPCESDKISANRWDEYDAMGNRLSQTQTLSKAYRSMIMDSKINNYVYDADKRLWQDNEFTYQYDSKGNLKTKTSIESTSVHWEYTWDATDKLRRVALYKNAVVDYYEEYIYDESGHRVKTTASEFSIIYVYSGDDLVYERKTEGTKINTKDYVHALGKLQAVVEEENGANKTVNYYYSDVLGSTRFIASETGTVVQENLFTPFGTELVNSYKTRTSRIYYQYAGHGESNDKTGLTYMNARWMDNQTGRFISPDPAQQGINYYVYCGNNPTTMIDPTGMMFAYSKATVDQAILKDYNDGFWAGQMGGYDFWFLHLPGYILLNGWYQLLNFLIISTHWSNPGAYGGGADIGGGGSVFVGSSEVYPGSGGGVGNNSYVNPAVTGGNPGITTPGSDFSFNWVPADVAGAFDASGAGSQVESGIPSPDGTLEMEAKNPEITINANVDPGKAAFFKQETLFPTIVSNPNKKDSLNIACLGTEIINAMSIQYTKLTGKVLTEDLAIKMANATVRNGSIKAGEGVPNVKKFMDAAWGVLANDKNIFWGQNKTGDLSGSWAAGGGQYHIGLGNRYNPTGQGGFYHWELILSSTRTVDSYIGGLRPNGSIVWTQDINIGFIIGGK